MTTDQAILFTLFGLVMALLIWGRFRYDVVAFCALVAGLLLGVVPADDAFTGFGHPATVIIALVLVVSRGLSNSGAIDILARQVVSGSRSVSAHIGVLAGVGAALSAVMNNVAALALLMPVDIDAASSAKRSPAMTLMPLSFATILGGLVTLIGTPPNVIISSFREDALGEPFGMFDFAPVGAACAVAGLLFIMSVGWRLIPAARREHDTARELSQLEGYITEVRVPEGSDVIGKRVRELDETAEDNDSAVIGLVRAGKRFPGLARRAEIQAGDVLVVEAPPEGIDKLVGALDLEYVRPDKDKEKEQEKNKKKKKKKDKSDDKDEEPRVQSDDVALMEVVVPEGAHIEGRTATSLRLPYRHGVTLLGVSRGGKRFRERVRKLEIKAGDLLLLLGPSERLSDVAAWLGCLPLAERGLQVTQRHKAWLAVGVFAAGIAAASLGYVQLPVALAGVVALYALLGIVPPRQLYDSVEWPVIVLLGALIPLGSALESSGGTALIADQIVAVSAGYSAVVVVALLMIVTMSLSDVLNNTATAVIAAPIAVDIATRLGVNADPFLMAVAVGASCAFLTPIGHKNNTLVMGPGGYRFGDYWRMGVPLEVIVVAVGVPMILWVWPL